MQRIRFFLTILPLFFLAVTASQAQETTTRTSDTSLTQKWTSEFGYSFMLPAKAKFNTLGSSVNKDGETQTANFILPGGAGSIKIWNYAERQIVPAGYKFLDSMVYFDIDSAGVNGKIKIRTYILHYMAVRMQVLLTPKGEPEYAHKVPAMFDSFIPPVGVRKELEPWRFEFGKSHK